MGRRSSILLHPLLSLCIVFFLVLTSWRILCVHSPNEYPQEEWGEIPLAFVVTQPGSAISETQIMEFVAKEVAPYKKIRKVEFVDTIPRNPSGKILRRELVSRALCVKASE